MIISPGLALSTLPRSAGPVARAAAQEIFHGPGQPGDIKTRSITTLGPASSDRDTLMKMLEAGMDIARLNCSHLKHEDGDKLVANLRTAARVTGRKASVLLDLRGPKVRLGSFPGGERSLKTGELVTLGDQGISFEPPHLREAMQPGKKILLKDGAVALRVLRQSEQGVECEVTAGGRLTDRCGLAVPGAQTRIDAFTEKDQRDLEWGLKAGVDMVAVSKVQRAEDLHAVRRFLDERGHDLPLCAKIEDVLALKNLDEIVAASDVIMVARGDLAVETPPHYVAVLQKLIVARCRELEKPVIVATEMMDSMIDNPSPKRAELADVTGAVLDGANATMTSAETAVGKYPVDVVAWMNETARAAEEAAALGGLSTPDRFSTAYWQKLVDQFSI
ncbi:pyruvate kinase [bacterium CPR1]|nr:pyruvate kinase [bacterium CPR1]